MSLVRALSALPAVVVLSLFTSSVDGQIYSVVPPGSNNRVAETTDTVQTADRLFHSGNNARGGYNVGDRSATAFTKTAPYLRDYSKMYDFTDVKTAAQYEMNYYENSVLQMQWMNEKGCGGLDTTGSSVNCELIIQFTCETAPEAQLAPGYMPGVQNLYNGGNTGKPKAPTSDTTIQSTQAANDAALVGRHESEQYYYNCMKRSRNKGLFVSTATLGDFAISTRQNPTGTQAGLECPEERDYYPYWSPSPWRDIVVLTDHAETFCNAGKYTDASQNNHRVYKCVPAAGATGATYDAQLKPITQADCKTAGGTWTPYSGGLPAPDCLLSPWSKDSHLGSGVDGRPLSYEWTIPSIAQLQGAGFNVYSDATTGTQYARCVTRMRYNVSSDEFDPYTADASSNGQLIPQNQSPESVDISQTKGGVQNIAAAGQSPVYVKSNVNAQSLSATYEDRSHTFVISARPAAFQGKNIVNLVSRGKRCNIVQCYPDVEYDFAPHDLTVAPDTLVAVQWTGSNTNNNAAGANDDGQDGSAGEGAANTDRINIAQVQDLAANYPIPLDTVQDNMWSRSTCYNAKGNYLSTGAADGGKSQPTGTMVNNGAPNLAATECALWLLSSGQFQSAAQANAAAANAFNPTLDTAPPSLIGGVVMQFNGITPSVGPQTYYYIGTRNNNFTNRGEKATISVDPTPGAAVKMLS